MILDPPDFQAIISLSDRYCAKHGVWSYDEPDPKPRMNFMSADYQI